VGENSYSVIANSEIRDRTGTGISVLRLKWSQLKIQASKFRFNGENTALGTIPNILNKKGRRLASHSSTTPSITGNSAPI